MNINIDEKLLEINILLHSQLYYTALREWVELYNTWARSGGQDFTEKQEQLFFKQLNLINMNIQFQIHNI